MLELPTAVTACVPPEGWVTYTVQGGDTLYAIAEAVGSSVEDLIAGNCLFEDQNITPGLRISVPNAPTAPVMTSVPFFPTGTLLPAEACTVPGVRIIAPVSGDSVIGVFNLVGAATLPTGGTYRIDIRPDSSETFTAYSRSDEPVVGGVLAQINSDLFDNGLHYIRLSVLDANGSLTQSCAIPVIFR